MFLIEAAVVEEQSVSLSGSKPTENHTIITIGIPAVLPPVPPPSPNTGQRFLSRCLSVAPIQTEQRRGAGEPRGSSGKVAWKGRAGCVNPADGEEEVLSLPAMMPEGRPVDLLPAGDCWGGGR